jgi:hypothetical protein
MDVNQTNSFTATVSNDAGNRGVNWTLTCAAGGSACGALAQSATPSGTANDYIAATSLSAAETVTITATSVSDSTKSASTSVTVNPALSLVSPSPAQPQPGVAGTAYSSNLNSYVQGGTPPCNWAVKTGAMPAGLALNGSTGVIGGTPTTAGTAPMAFNCTDSGHPPISLPASLQISLVIKPAGGLSISSGSPPNGAVAAGYNPGNGMACFPVNGVCRPCFPAASSRICPPGWRFQNSFFFAATGGTAPYTWSWAAASNSSVPPGLTLFSAGSLRGTPTAAGTYHVIVTVTDSGATPSTVSANYTIVILAAAAPVISTIPAPAAGAVNIPYSFTFQVASGGQAPFSWRQQGALPPGLALNSGGTLSGTPTITGQFPLTVMVQDETGRNAVPQDFVIQVSLHGFKTTGSMMTARGAHTATLLSDGRVLVTGGTVADGTATASAELYNPTSATFAATSHMGTPRTSHTATLLNNGKVLVTGGGTALAEIFDPADGAFAPTANMGATRIFHSATLLNDGKILVTGGGDENGTPVASAELFDPSSGFFTPTGSLNVARYGHTATLLDDGRVLVTGGTGIDGKSIATAEIFSLSSGGFSLTGDMALARYAHSATLLSNGRVLVAGGFDVNFLALATAELFDPATGIFTATGSMDTQHAFHAAVLLNDGTVLVVAGEDAVRNSLSSAELFDPATGEFTSTGGVQSGRTSSALTLLNNGRALLTGGISGNGSALSSADIYQ